MGVQGIGFSVGGKAIPSTYPRYRRDRALTDGSLLLIEPGHSSSTLVGVPASGASIENLARTEAARLCATTESAVDAAWVLGSDVGAPKWKSERTPGGALHLVVSQTADSANTAGYFNAATAVTNYIHANTEDYTSTPTKHLFGLFLWTRVTRATPASVSGKLPGYFCGPGVVGGSVSGTPRAAARFTPLTPVDSEVSTFPTTFVPVNSPARQSLNVPTFRAQQFRFFNGGRPTSAADVLARFGAGCIPPYNAAWFTNISQSCVIERVHLVDLTAAGMSWDTMLAREQAEWAAAHASGGRYYGDTVPTDPASIP